MVVVAPSQEAELSAMAALAALRALAARAEAATSAVAAVAALTALSACLALAALSACLALVTPPRLTHCCLSLAVCLAVGAKWAARGVPQRVWVRARSAWTPSAPSVAHQVSVGAVASLHLWASARAMASLHLRVTLRAMASLHHL